MAYIASLNAVLLFGGTDLLNAVVATVEKTDLYLYFMSNNTWVTALHYNFTHIPIGTDILTHSTQTFIWTDHNVHSQHRVDIQPHH
jgi:hypothetical protein